MSKITSGLMAAAVMATFAFAAAVPATAHGGGGCGGGGGMSMSGGGGGHIGGGGGGHFSGPMGGHQMAFSGHRGGPVFFGDHHGFRDDRHFHNRFFPFIFGSGGDLALMYAYDEPDYGYVHAQWCYNHYRSYRAYDNTFQPINGPRQQCYTPYG